VIIAWGVNVGLGDLAVRRGPGEEGCGTGLWPVSGGLAWASEFTREVKDEAV
jgi:hypothetical protein